MPGVGRTFVKIQDTFASFEHGTGTRVVAAMTLLTARPTRPSGSGFWADYTLHASLQTVTAGRSLLGKRGSSRQAGPVMKAQTRGAAMKRRGNGGRPATSSSACTLAARGLV